MAGKIFFFFFSQHREIRSRAQETGSWKQKEAEGGSRQASSRKNQSGKQLVRRN